VSRIVANLREAIRGGRDEATVLDLAAVACGAALEAARSFGAADRLEIENDGRVMAVGASGPVELAVSNMVRNAIEASDPGARIRLTVSGDEMWAEIRVEDSGPGVAEENLERVFEPFFSTKTDRGGTGMGLAITRDMIANLGGEVSLENLPSGGARATVRLRRWKESEASS